MTVFYKFYQGFIKVFQFKRGLSDWGGSSGGVCLSAQVRDIIIMLIQQDYVRRRVCDSAHRCVHVCACQNAAPSLVINGSASALTNITHARMFSGQQTGSSPGATTVVYFGLTSAQCIFPSRTSLSFHVHVCVGNSRPCADQGSRDWLTAGQRTFGHQRTFSLN